MFQRSSNQAELTPDQKQNLRLEVIRKLPKVGVIRIFDQVEITEPENVCTIMNAAGEYVRYIKIYVY